MSEQKQVGTEAVCAGWLDRVTESVRRDAASIPVKYGGDSQPEPPSAELLRALRWALPLAIIEQERHRSERLQHGHHDIGAGRGHDLGLWDSEVAARDQAKAALSRAEPAGPVRTDAVLDAKLECVQRLRNFAAAYIDNCNADALSLVEIEAAQAAIMQASNDINAWARGLTPHPAQPSLDALNGDVRALLPEGDKAHG